MRRLWGLLLVLGCHEGGTVALGPEAPGVAQGWLADVEQPLPTWLSQAGIYADLADQTPAGVLIPYAPPHPLYSNGTSKDRYLYLPPDTTIDASDPDAWDFPVGTVLVKTFRYADVEGRAGDVQIETRLIFRRADGWDYAEYHWNQEGTQARLLEGNWAPQDLELEGPDGRFPYTLPARLDCRACHDTHVGSPVIGIDPYNLDPDLLEAGVFAAPPKTVELAARTPEEAAAMSYFVGNCAHCHHGVRGSENASFSLRPEDVLANTIGQETESSASGFGVRVVPGDPEGSAIYEAVVETRRPDYRGDFKPMPPAGIDRADPDAARILSAWIGQLE